jgi:hypothetical protein
MKPVKPTVAAAELLLIFPAVLFMGSLCVRELQPLQYQPARIAQKIVDWYAARPHVGLWIMLIALPLAVLTTGCFAIIRHWKNNAELRQATRQSLTAIRSYSSTLFVAVATLTAAVVLVIVALHMITD